MTSSLHIDVGIGKLFKLAPTRGGGGLFKTRPFWIEGSHMIQKTSFNRFNCIYGSFRYTRNRDIAVNRSNSIDVHSLERLYTSILLRLIMSLILRLAGPPETPNVMEMEYCSLLYIYINLPDGPAGESLMKWEKGELNLSGWNKKQDRY